MATNSTRVVIETWQKKDGFFTPAAWLGTTLVALLAASVFVISKKTSSSSNNFPLMNPRKFYDIGGIRAKLSFVFGARKLLALGVRTGRPFRLLTDLGEMIVLPARYATEIRSDPRLSFAEVIVQVIPCRKHSKVMFPAHGLMRCWSRPRRIFMRIFQASKGSAREPQMPTSVATSRTISSRILSVGAGTTPNSQMVCFMPR